MARFLNEACREDRKEGGRRKKDILREEVGNRVTLNIQNIVSSRREKALFVKRKKGSQFRGGGQLRYSNKSVWDPYSL